MANSPRIPLPKGWPTRVKSAMLHVISLAQYAAVYTRSSWRSHAAIRVTATIHSARLPAQKSLD